MTRPDSDRLDAYVDGELPPADAADVERAIREDEATRDAHAALVATRAALGDVFADAIATAPLPPASIPGAASTHVRRRIAWVPWLTGCGIAAALAIAAWIGTSGRNAAPEPVDAPSTPKSLLPRDVVARAAKEFRSLRDAELLVTMESAAIDLLKALLDDKKPEDRKKTRFFFRTRVQSPDRFAMFTVANRRDPMPVFGEDASGSDGEWRWSYDRENAEVVRYPADGPAPAMQWSVKSSSVTKSTTTFDTDNGADGVLRCLNFGFLEELEANDPHLVYEETTGPSDERAGRRVFRVRRTDKADEWVTDAIELTVDPMRDRLERVRFDVRLTVVSLISFTVDVAATNRGFTKRDFDPRRYVATDVTVRDATPEEIEKARKKDK